MPVRMPVLRLVARLHLIALCGLVALLAARGSGSAQTAFSTLYEFEGPPDAANPAGPLISDASGALYGTTAEGGNLGCVIEYQGAPAGCGTVFKLTPPATPGGAWTESVLYSFSNNGSDGYPPEGSLTFDASGALYGTTFNGGTHGGGTVFKLTPPTISGGSWTEAVLYSFTGGGSDGGFPFTGVIADKSGALYGTTGSGGTGYGTVFKLTPPATSGGAWAERTLYSFTGASDGGGPYAGLIFDASGALYSTTAGGGTNGGGTVFKLTPPAISGGAWTETVLYSFCSQTNCTDGKSPLADVIFDASGALYGTTEEGGTGGYGSAFKLTPPATSGGAWTESVLHSFTGTGGDGPSPNAGLIFDASGALYGTTGSGGNRGGTVFRLTPSKISGGVWTATELHSFAGGSDGAFPRGPLIFGASGALYGATWQGGTGCISAYDGVNGCGTVFKLSGAGTPLSENPQTSDFNADRKSDILLQNATSGEMWMWEMNGRKVIGAGSPDNPGPGWKVIGAGDFYGSLYSDILAQNTTSGEVWIWEMNGNKVVGKGSPGNLGPSWHVIGTGDFNGDGYSDILFQNATTGQIWIWEMNGLKVIASGSPDNPGPSWRVVGAGDFNGDGYSDILAQNTTSGEVWIWEMNGLKVIGKGSPGNLGPNWHVIGTGDFNGDGYSDILFQNATTGEIWIWEMDGLKVIASGSPDNPGPSWRVVGTGDFNGDGYSDILAQNTTSGEVWVWEMNGLKVIGKGSPGNLGPSWQVIGE